MPEDPFKSKTPAIGDPLSRVRQVVPSDDEDLPDGLSRCLYVGVAGAVVFVDASGSEVTIISGAHQWHPVRVARVKASGTDADSILAGY